jgi:ribosomal protein S18 acetylase RimI-like enzyme
MKFLIRKARLKDWKDIQKVGATVFEANKKYDPALDLNWPFSKAAIKYYQSAFLKKDNCKLVAEVDDLVAGYLFGGKFAYSYRKVTYGEIKDMGVLPAYRRKGIGTKLVSEFRKWCRAKGYSHLYVNTYNDDPRAVSFYKKQGMVPSDLVLIGEV